MKNALAVLFGLGAILAVAPVMGALTTADCDGDSANGLSRSDDCSFIYDQDATGNGDVKLEVLDEELFGENTWVSFGKQEESGSEFDADGANDYNFQVVNNSDDDAIEGTWSFDASVWQEFYKVALVMKDGKNAVNNESQAGVYAYLLDSQAQDRVGNWGTAGVFENNNDEPSALSNMTAYGVPTPGALGLLGMGLLGLAAAARRRSDATA